jgi:hypothetical protein
VANGDVRAEFEIAEEFTYEYEGAFCPAETGVLFHDASYCDTVTLAGSGGIAIDVGRIQRPARSSEPIGRGLGQAPGLLHLRPWR